MDLSPLPEELLVEIVKVLEWGDILRIRRTSKRLNAISKSLSVWRAMVKNVPPQMLWLERPMKTYSAAELERLFLRRRRAEAGYEAIANRGLPRWRTIEVEEPVMLPFDIVPGGRWLLVPNKKGRILYYDLDQQDRPGRVLVPEKGFLCSPQMSIDVDLTSPYLKFNLAVGSRSGIEVWQVDLVLDEYGNRLCATCRASFRQEPLGYCDSLSLLGESLAFTISQDSTTVYTVVVTWRSVQGQNYSKRFFRLPKQSLVSLLPGGTLIYACPSGLALVSGVSLPIVTTMPVHPQPIPPLAPNTFLVSLEGTDEATFSKPTVCDDTIRFVVGAHEAIYGVTLIPNTSQGDHGYQVETIELFKFSPLPERILSVSEDFVVVWSSSRGLIMQRVSWSNPTASCFPAAEADQGILLDWGAGHFHQLDMTSGRLLVDQRGAYYITIIDLTSFLSRKRFMIQYDCTTLA